ncbi:MAG: FAD-binding protein, partial [Anaerolineaceae bacterium]|nr:FAD-binding protein [Anaerolineaceae bacterium]
MTAAIRPSVPMDALRLIFGSQLRENIPMADYTTAHVGGTADALLIANNNLELESACRRLWDLDVFFCVLGSGSNVLVSDGGIRGVVIINRARALRINHPADSPSVWVESGASLSGLARQVALRGLSGLEWAAGIPGTVGGAVVNNAGSREGNIQTSLMVAEILHQVNGKEIWSSSQFGYAYRSSILKGMPRHAVILTAELKLVPSTLEEVQSRMSALNARRRETQ